MTLAHPALAVPGPTPPAGYGSHVLPASVEYSQYAIETDVSPPTAPVKSAISAYSISACSRSTKSTSATSTVKVGVLSITVSMSVGDTIDTVSYTHLRAHETKANLVCRLLLE